MGKRTEILDRTAASEQSRHKIDDQVEVYELVLPTSVAAKDESKDAVLKKLECED